MAGAVLEQLQLQVLFCFLAVIKTMLIKLNFMRGVRVSDTPLEVEVCSVYYLAGVSVVIGFFETNTTAYFPRVLLCCKGNLLF